MGRLLQRLVVLLAFAGVILAPALARAALLPACEVHELTRMPVEWLVAEAGDACDAGPTAADEQVDVKVAGMCDDRGASIVAPPRIHAIVDARIEAGNGWAFDHSAPHIGPSPQDSPLSSPPLALLDQATLQALAVVAPAASELAPPFPPLPGGPRPGVSRGIDHPPR
jgi:hypothetical protein